MKSHRHTEHHAESVGERRVDASLESDLRHVSLHDGTADPSLGVGDHRAIALAVRLGVEGPSVAIGLAIATSISEAEAGAKSKLEAVGDGSGAFQIDSGTHGVRPRMGDSEPKIEGKIVPGERDGFGRPTAELPPPPTPTTTQCRGMRRARTRF